MSAVALGLSKCDAPRIITFPAEQPPGVEFLRRALERATAKEEIVLLERRSDQSILNIDVPSLRWTYQRFRAGRRLRWILGTWLDPRLALLDPLSATWIGNRDALTRALSLCEVPGLLGDVELALRLLEQGQRIHALPGLVYLPAEKKRAQVLLESLEIGFQLPRLARQKARKAPVAIAHGTADDWGLSAGVNAGILELARRGIIRRVSVLADGQAISDGLEELKKLPVQIGLHFNLTYGPHAVGRSPGSMMLRWLLASRAKRAQWAKNQFQRQTQALANLGVQVSYLDGHHHMHVLPGLLKILAPDLMKQGIKKTRLPLDPKRWIGADVILLALALSARSSIKKLGLEVLDFTYPRPSDHRSPRKLLELIATHPGYEILFHPARSNDLSSLDFPEPHYQEERLTEFRCLTQLHESGLLRGQDGP